MATRCRPSRVANARVRRTRRDEYAAEGPQRAAAGRAGAATRIRRFGLPGEPGSGSRESYNAAARWPAARDTGRTRRRPSRNNENRPAPPLPALPRRRRRTSGRQTATPWYGAQLHARRRHARRSSRVPLRRRQPVGTRPRAQSCAETRSLACRAKPRPTTRSRTDARVANGAGTTGRNGGASVREWAMQRRGRRSDYMRACLSCYDTIARLSAHATCGTNTKPCASPPFGSTMNLLLSRLWNLPGCHW